MELNTNVSNFYPVLGGIYRNGKLLDEAVDSRWWGSTAESGMRRYFLDYNGSRLSATGKSRRFDGIYIRCVSEEKAITSLTYMQDMTFAAA